MSVVSVHNLRFAFPAQEPLLHGVNFQVSPGGILVVCGMSGTGKSTLLRLLAGLERPDAGVVRVLGQDISNLGETAFNHLKTKIGFVFQSPALISNRTIWENVALPLQYHNLGDEDEIRYRVDNALEMLLIREHRDSYPAGLSLGIRKRAALARAMITRPSLILMDEPTAGLDRISRGLLLALIGNIRRLNRVAMVIVTHDLAAARELEGEIGVLKDGEMLEPMTFDQLRHSQDSFVEFLFHELEEEARTVGATVAEKPPGTDWSGVPASADKSVAA